MSTTTSPINLTDSATIARNFASAEVAGGNYVFRREILRSIANASVETLQALSLTARTTLLSLIGREFQRYSGTYKPKGKPEATPIRLAFRDSKNHKGNKLAVWYYADLKAAGAKLNLAFPRTTPPAATAPEPQPAAA